ncbi:DUF6355 family natural product biosynthesis protein [Amycolatopsis sp. NPDC051128]|uniref:DUF6355 family natural product biosynthesis protein n=1 Tax=Amycolatopsis sp. NPDC051128 TaxID=3155412 RepID=UPI003420FF51
MASTTVSAAPGTARTTAACGYREEYPFTYWYNCRSTNVKIRVDVLAYPDYDYCTLPGDNLLDSGSTRTRGAREIGGC